MYIHPNDAQPQTDGPVTLSLTSAPVTLSLTSAPVTMDIQPVLVEAVTTDHIMILPTFDDEVTVTTLPVFDEDATITTLPLLDQGLPEPELTEEAVVTSLPVSQIVSYAQDRGAFDAQSNAEQIENLYQIILQRDSDQAGKDYWIEQNEVNGMTMQEIAQSFVDSEEFAEQYSEAPEAWDFLIA